MDQARLWIAGQDALGSIVCVRRMGDPYASNVARNFTGPNDVGEISESGDGQGFSESLIASRCSRARIGPPYTSSFFHSSSLIKSSV